MIEVKIDVLTMERITNDVSHSIEMVKTLKRAGIPLRGILLAKGIERGEMRWRTLEDLDGDTWVIEWTDTHEKPGHQYKQVASGGGTGYTFKVYEDITVPPPKRVEDDEL